MRQEIYEDRYGHRCLGIRGWFPLASSTWPTVARNIWQSGDQLPHTPPTAKDYTSAGLPWFDYYGDSKALAGSVTIKQADQCRCQGD